MLIYEEEKTLSYFCFPHAHEFCDSRLYCVLWSPTKQAESFLAGAKAKFFDFLLHSFARKRSRTLPELHRLLPQQCRVSIDRLNVGTHTFLHNSNDVFH